MKKTYCFDIDNVICSTPKSKNYSQCKPKKKVINFKVNYVLIPYTGVSSIDLRFSVKNKTTLENFIKHLKEDINAGDLKNIYGYSSEDSDANTFNLTKNSMEIIIPNITIKNHNIYIHGYFDNENSVNRFFDLSNYLIKRL